MRKSIRSKAASANLMVAVLAAIASYYAWEMFLNEGDSVKAFIGLSLLMMTTVSSSSLYIIQKSIIDPLLLMGEEIRSLNPNNLPVKRLSCGGEDEIAGLADEINKMLSRFEEGNQDLREKNKQLQMVLDGGNIGFWDFQIPSGALYVSQKAGEILGINSGDVTITRDRFIKRICTEDIFPALEKLRAAIAGSRGLDYLEFRLLNSRGEYQWVAIRGGIVEMSDTSGKPLRMTGIIMDVHERKKVEEELKHLSYYDKLTGLCRREHFEYMLERKIAQAEFPFSLIIGDINGLKGANNTFGHTAGDAIIITVADVLKKVCGEKGIISRWGGDEFAIILKDADTEEAEKVCMEISKECFDLDNKMMPLNFSMGYSVAGEGNNELQVIIKQAEERMNRNKLFDNNSVRSGIIASLQRALEEKSYETEEHVERIGENCLKMGQKLGLDAAQIDELLLLALMHDIGKIAIPDYILDKPEPLDPEEWEIMKSHSEIGFRIASATPELSHIAHAILAHHEHYDGTGYPNGLKGEEILLISRILSIVDAFDVMTHERGYKEAMTCKEAIEEIARCGGTQFDPWLVEVFISVLAENEVEDEEAG